VSKRWKVNAMEPVRDAALHAQQRSATEQCDNRKVQRVTFEAFAGIHLQKLLSFVVHGMVEVKRA
tara:strand:- start:9880 stop:10074 length:195 start_codon:yes stop_codon:yes gene_type:complete